jgi:lipopolysaccharide/colanic/teichoic acid biosynthesis glycosyltransferase
MSDASKTLPFNKQSKLTASGRDKNRHLYLWTKRLFDVVFAVCAIMVTAPLMVFGAVAVKLSSPGPILYRAKRAGLKGRPFDMVKLRTMYVGTDMPDRKITAAQDNRVTPVGRLLRKFKIDELPQFWNVLRGDMSIVGPRPEDYDIVTQFYTPEQWRTLDIRPGIASPADVRWYPDLTYHDPPPAGTAIYEWYLERHMPAQLSESLRYVEQRTLLLDLKVLVQTARCMLVYSWRPPKVRPLLLEPLPEKREIS